MYESVAEPQQKINTALDHVLELKRKYRQKIMIELPNIAVEHIANHSDMDNELYKGCLKYGCGTEHLVISQDGALRPCHTLSSL